MPYKDYQKHLESQRERNRKRRENLTPEQKELDRQYSSEWRKKNKEKRNAQYRRWYWEHGGKEKVAARVNGTEYARFGARKRDLKRKYGLTPEEYDKILQEQDERCKICRTHASEAKGQKLHVDHDHDTGNVRGLLCHHCNVSLGLMKESPELLRIAADYLDTHRKKD